MPLTAGARLGPYEVLSLLGAGGMGEVYRARDPRLGREVAIKVLPRDRADDEGRRRRFLQEARAASALNHPSIVAIHEIGSEDGADFIVMEHVKGRTLDAVIRAGLSLDEGLRIAIPIADALARAHTAGIVHRDLKPANVMVTPEGAVKVLDFGLAKLLGPRETSEDEATETAAPGPSSLTGSGMVVGTPGYMSPEQATGGKLDTRSDVFSFGALLYEMVTGRRPFAGGSREETLRAVIGQPPKPPSEIAPGMPKDLEKVILRCLRKEPERRFQSMADVKVELLEVLEDLHTPTGPATGPVSYARWAVAGLLILAIATGAWWLWRARAPSPAPRLVPVTTAAGTESWPTLSPDGTQVAYSGEGERSAEGVLPDRDLWVKIIGGFESRRLTSGPDDDWAPSWSPDGRQIAFLRFPKGNLNASGTIHLVSALGGTDLKLGDFPAGFSQLSWSLDGRWLAARRARQPNEAALEAAGIYLVPVNGGDPQAITTATPTGFDHDPAFSPDGSRLAYVSCPHAITPTCDIYVLGLGGDLVPKAAPRRLTRHLATIHGMAWARDGRSIVYGLSAIYLYGRGLGSQLWRVGTDGDRPPERIESARQGSFSPAIAGARDRLVFAQDRLDIDIYRFEGGRPARPVVASSFVDYSPSFSPDGRRIAFESSQSGEAQEIWLANPDGQNPVQLTGGPVNLLGQPRWRGSPSWSPDGRRIVFGARAEDGNPDLWTIDADGGSMRRLTDDALGEGPPHWSHDGRWVYYRQDGPEGSNIARIPAGGGTPELLARNGGPLVVESTDGSAIFYSRPGPVGPAPLFSMPAAGGPERMVADCVQNRALASSRAGIFYVGCAPDSNEVTLCRLDLTTRRTTVLGKLERAAIFIGLGVSSDGKTILFGKGVAEGADLMMIENFR